MDIETLCRQYKSLGDHRSVCPFCSHDRSKSKEHCLSITTLQDRWVWNCWHCERSGVVHEKPYEPHPVSAPVKRVINGTKPIGSLTPAGADWLLDERGIELTTAQAFQLGQARRFFTSQQTELDAIVIPYFDKGKRYAAKCRAISVKAHTQDGAASTFFNIDNIDPDQPIIITEGEWDAMCVWQSGHKNVVSVPNGAPSKTSEGKVDPRDDRKFGYVWHARDALTKCKKVIIAVDSDAPGDALAEELARRIGRDKCWRVAWPEGVKDANDMLLADGASGIDEAIQSARPWPVVGLYDARHYQERVEHLYSKGMGKGQSTGLLDVDTLFTLVPGQVAIVTGIPGSGKSEFIDQIAVNVAEQVGWKTGYCSFENPPHLHIPKLLEKKVRAPFFEGPTQRMTTVERDRAMVWVQEHMAFMEFSDGNPPTIDNILEKARTAVMRYGIRMLVIDPYNYIERDIKEQETQYISDMLTKVRAFATSHDVLVWFVAHPMKLMRMEGKTPVPKGYDISGSAAWFSKADLGITVHRNDETGKVDIHVWKVRFRWVGKQGICSLDYSPVTSRYSESIQVKGNGHGYSPREDDRPWDTGDIASSHHVN